MNLRNVILLFVSLAAGNAFGAAVLTIFLDTPSALLLPGTTVNFSGTIINNTSDYVSMNSIAVDGLPADFSVDTTPFLNGPYPLNPLDSTGDFTLFSVTSPLGYAGPFGALPATVTILGGTDTNVTSDFSENPLGNTTVTVVAPDLTPAPEPGTALLFTVGLLLVFAAPWKSRARVGREVRMTARSQPTAEPGPRDLNNLGQHRTTLTVTGPASATQRGMWRVNILLRN